MTCFADMAWHGMASWHWIGPSEYYAIPQWCKVCFENLRIIFKRKRGKRIHKLRLAGKSFIFYFDASPFIHQNNFPPKFNCESCYWQSTDRHCLLFWNAAKFLVSLFQTNFCQFVAILTSKGFHHSQNLKKWFFPSCRFFSSPFLLQVGGTVGPADTMSALSVISTGPLIAKDIIAYYNMHIVHIWYVISHCARIPNDNFRDCRYGEYCNSGKKCVRQLRDANR